MVTLEPEDMGVLFVRVETRVIEAPHRCRAVERRLQAPMLSRESARRHQTRLLSRHQAREALRLLGNDRLGALVLLELAQQCRARSERELRNRKVSAWTCELAPVCERTALTRSEVLWSPPCENARG